MTTLGTIASIKKKGRKHRLNGLMQFRYVLFQMKTYKRISLLSLFIIKKQFASEHRSNRKNCYKNIKIKCFTFRIYDVPNQIGKRILVFSQRYPYSSTSLLFGMKHAIFWQRQTMHNCIVCNDSSGSNFLVDHNQIAQSKLQVQEISKMVLPRMCFER